MWSIATFQLQIILRSTNAHAIHGEQLLNLRRSWFAWCAYHKAGPTGLRSRHPYVSYHNAVPYGTECVQLAMSSSLVGECCWSTGASTIRPALRGLRSRHPYVSYHNAVPYRTNDFTRLVMALKPYEETCALCDIW